MPYSSSPLEEPKKAEQSQPTAMQPPDMCTVEKERLEFQVHEMKSNVVEKRAELKRSREEMEAAEGLLQAAIAKRNSTQATWSAKEKKAVEMESTIKGMEEFETIMMATVNSQLGGKQKTLSALNGKIAEKQAAVKELTVQKEAAASDNAAHLSSLSADLEAASSSLTSRLTQAVDEGDETLSSANDVFNKSDEALTALKEELSHLAPLAISSPRRKRAKTAAPVRSIDIAKSLHKEELANKEGLLSELADELKQKNDAIKKMKSSIAKLDNQPLRLETSKNSVATARKACSEELKKLCLELQEVQKLSMLTKEMIISYMTKKLKEEEAVWKGKKVMAEDRAEVMDINEKAEKEQTDGDALMAELKEKMEEGEGESSLDTADLQSKQQQLKAKIKSLEEELKITQSELTAEKQAVKTITAKLILADPDAGYTIPQTPKALPAEPPRSGSPHSNDGDSSDS
eukprot:TRINITY_DN13676_c1_g1_i2.p1 TRINITY_DN13676_c1_g1~~TRINITY_DN13676_c1_g1_i2.p1  ORF type:complete len:460 (+),score=164.83 TRINITY_DN13676_c1_g1_i2:57-1436(+)